MVAPPLRRALALLAVVASLAACSRREAGAPAGPATRPTVAIVPLGPVDPAALAAAKRAALDRFEIDVVVLDERPLPAAAFYPPRKRYRALGLLDDLEATADARYAKVVGVTAADISVTKGEIYDWGIFGLGRNPGTSCVVSTFRLRHGGASKALFEARLGKIVDHEIGHTFGLPHCPHAGCLMQDAAGTIATIDAESGDFCADCERALGGTVAIRRR